MSDAKLTALISIYVKVSDVKALARAARQRYRNDNPNAPDAQKVIRDDDVDAALRALFGPGKSQPGYTIIDFIVKARSREEEQAAQADCSAV